MLAARRMMGHPGYFDLVMSQQPVFYYRMNDTAYTTMAESVEGYNGAYSGNYFTFQQASLLKSGQGKSVYFQSTTNCGVITYKAAMNNTQSISFSCLIRPSEISATPAKLIFHTGDTGISNNQGVMFGLSGALAYFQFYNGVTWTVVYSSSGFFPTANIPYHIAMVASASGKYCKVYRNGTLLDTLTWATNSWANCAQNWKIGAYETGIYYSNAIQYWRIQEFAIWQSLLSVQNIAAQANAA